jgi:drug/metabolite transporter (DMT)-like permease
VTQESSHSAKAAPPSTGMTLLAFGIIYFVWGSTFLAIRIGVLAVPPLLFAAMRFLLAGLALYAWTLFRGERVENARQWLSALLLGFLIFVGDYGCLFWAEQRVASGVAAVLLATIPAFMALSEIAFLRTQRLTLRLALALLVGLCGVAVLVNRTLKMGDAPVDRAGAIAIIIGAGCWSVASVLTRKLPLPPSKSVSSGAQMLLGGVMLLLAAAARGELRGFHPAAVPLEAWLALVYLIVFGSIIGFTAYLWLIHYQSPTKVGTYAYVNPVVAVLLGYLAGGEPLGARTAVGALCVLASVVLITTARAAQPSSLAGPDPVAEPE